MYVEFYEPAVLSYGIKSLSVVGSKKKSTTKKLKAYTIIMRFIKASSRLAFIGSQLASRQNGSGTRFPALLQTSSLNLNNHFLGSGRPIDTRLFSSGGQGEVTLQNIGKEEMEEIIEDYEKGGREESGYVIFDVREPHEIEFTGKLSENTLTLPLQKLAQYNVFSLEEDEFEEICGFEKPTPDETIVFSCAAGIRSVHAAQFAAQNGYSKLVNYMGGANEWFS